MKILYKVNPETGHIIARRCVRFSATKKSFYDDYGNTHKMTEFHYEDFQEAKQVSLIAKQTLARTLNLKLQKAQQALSNHANLTEELVQARMPKPKEEADDMF